MCIGRPKDAQGISWRHRAPMVARAVLGDISENTERINCYATMITTHTFVYFQQSDASCVIGKIKGGNQSQLLLLFLFVCSRGGIPHPFCTDLANMLVGPSPSSLCICQYNTWVETTTIFSRLQEQCTVLNNYCTKFWTHVQTLEASLSDDVKT